MTYCILNHLLHPVLLNQSTTRRCEFLYAKKKSP